MKISPHDIVLIDQTVASLVWSSLEHYYKGSFVLSIGDLTPDWAYGFVEPLSEGDIQLLLSRACVMFADTDRYKALAEEAEVRFFKVIA